MYSGVRRIAERPIFLKDETDDERNTKSKYCRKKVKNVHELSERIQYAQIYCDHKSTYEKVFNKLLVHD